MKAQLSKEEKLLIVTRTLEILKSKYLEAVNSEEQFAEKFTVMELMYCYTEGLMSPKIVSNTMKIACKELGLYEIFMDDLRWKQKN